ncbi:MAG: YfhO family protein [Defluviitaleaceae bacterium]|nr:YfhO family protein [Defluviitaleaceae bacterium]
MNVSKIQKIAKNLEDIAIKASGNVYFLYTILFAVIFAVGYSPFWQNGRSFIRGGDGAIQWFPGFHYMGRFLREIIRNALQGDFNIAFFDFGLNFGSDVLASNFFPVNFGILHLFTVFVPSRYAEIYLNVFTVLGIYLSGVTFIHFAKYMKQANYASIIGALTYVFSGWVFADLTWHPNMFLYPLLYLPLMIEGLERAITGKKPYLLVISTSLMAIAGFYWLYMILVFFVPYALIRVHYFYPKNYIKNLFGKAGIAAVYTILGLLISSVISIPTLFFILNNEGMRGFNTTNVELWTMNMNFYRDFFMRFISGNANNAHLFLSAISIFAIIWLIFDGTKNTLSQRMHWLALVVVLITLRLVPFGSILMHGLSYYSTRWTFIIVFVVALVVTISIPHMQVLRNKMFAFCLLITSVYGFMATIIPRYRNIWQLMSFAMLAATLVILAYNFSNSKPAKINDDEETGKTLKSLEKPATKKSILVFFGITKFNPDKTSQYQFTVPNLDSISQSVNFKQILLVMVVSANLMLNSYFAFGEGIGNIANNFRVFGSVHQQHPEIPSNLVLRDRFFRIDTQAVMPGAPMTRDYLGMTSGKSITNPNLLQFLNDLEKLYYSGTPFTTSFYFQQFGHEVSLNAIASVEYFVTHHSLDSIWLNVPYGFENPTQYNDLNIFRNQNWLPFGFTYQNAINYNDFMLLDSVRRRETLLQAVVLNSNQTIPNLEFDTYRIPFEIAETNNLTWEDGILRVAQNNATITLNFDDSAAYSELYIRLSNFMHNTMSVTNMTFDTATGRTRRFAALGGNVWRYMYHDFNYTHNLGFSEEPRSSVTITFAHAGNFTLDNIEILALPMQNFADRTAALHEHTLTNLNMHNRGIPGLTNRITGEITLPDSRYLFLSIPYSAGWRAYVNGQPAELLQANIAFMALELPAGHHEIELRYRTPGMTLGFILSLVGIAVFVLLVKFYPKISAKLKITELEIAE